jgi:hypothetical protein
VQYIIIITNPQTMDLREVEKASVAIREKYHKLEKQYHGSEWSLEEDALAFLTDAGLVGRWAMSHAGRWPSDESSQLPAKIGECVWWLAEMSARMGIDFEQCVTKFLKDKNEQLSV